MRSPDIKFCEGPCQTEKPIEEFDLDSSKRDGYKAWCKDCRKERRQESASEAVQLAVEHLDSNALAALREMQPGGGNMPPPVIAIERILQLLGGVNGFAMFYVGNMLAAQPGGQVRQRMLEKILVAIQTNAADPRVSKPRHLMSDEELEAEKQERLTRLGYRVVKDAG